MSATILPSEGLTFDDVLLVPQSSDLVSREDVNLNVKLGPYTVTHPIIPANMKSIMTPSLIGAAQTCGGVIIAHRFQDQDLQLLDLSMVANPGLGVMVASVGVKAEESGVANFLIQEGVTVFCVDVAHGDSKACRDMVNYLKGRGVFVIAGNVATAAGARRLFDAGADVVKVGVGPGSLCTTRVETGNGVPQLTALMDVDEMRQRWYPERQIIADGGIKNAGDCVKALCFADFVMLGRVFAGCNEASRRYEGSSTHNTSHIEGVVADIPPTGKSYSETLDRLLSGIRSGCSYQGVRNLQELKESPVFIRITQAGLVESKPHDVEVVS
jgi:IMP dehydrogenase